MTDACPHGLPILTRQIPHDIQYVLDCALECNEIDMGSYIALQLFAKTDDLDRMVNAPRGWTSHRRTEMTFGLAEFASTLICQLTPQWRGGLAYASFLRFHGDLDNWVEFYASTAIQDALEGGCLVGYRRPRRGQTPRRRGPTDSTFPLTAKIRRRLHSPAFIRRCVKRYDDSPRLRRRFEIIAARMKGLDTGGMADHYAVIEKALQEQRAAINARQRAAIESAQATYVLEAETIWLDEQLQSGADVARLKPQSLKTSALRRAMRAHRRVVKRALSLATAVLGEGLVRTFVAGKAVVLSGATVDFRVTCRGGAMRNGHGALAVEVTDKTGISLATLCLFIDDTPAIEQLMAMALHLKEDDGELEILSKANLITVTDASVSHPTLKARAAKMQEARRTAPLDNYAGVRERNRQYVAATRAIWREALEVYIYGRPVTGRARRGDTADARRPTTTPTPCAIAAQLDARLQSARLSNQQPHQLSQQVIDEGFETLAA